MIKRTKSERFKPLVLTLCGTISCIAGGEALRRVASKHEHESPVLSNLMKKIGIGMEITGTVVAAFLLPKNIKNACTKEEVNYKVIDTGSHLENGTKLYTLVAKDNLTGKEIFRGVIPESEKDDLIQASEKEEKLLVNEWRSHAKRRAIKYS